MSVLVFIDTRGAKVAKAALEALTYGRKVADASGTTVTAVTFGDTPADQLGALSANKVVCLLYTSPSPRDRTRSRMPSSA